MPLWVPDFLADVQDLDAREIGAYMLILMSMWQRGGSLVADDRKLQRVARVSRNWPDVWAAIECHFEIVDGVIYNPRLSSEFTKARAKSAVNSYNGKRGAAAKALKTNKPAQANAQGSLMRTVKQQEPKPYLEEKGPVGRPYVGRPVVRPDDEKKRADELVSSFRARVGSGGKSFG